MNRLYTIKELNKIAEYLNPQLKDPMHYIEVERLVNPKNGLIKNDKIKIPALSTKNYCQIVLDLNQVLG